MNVDHAFLEEHHVIGRLKLAELLDRHSPFRDLKDGVERRFSLALDGIPDEHQEAALAIFANVIYLPRPMLDESWRYLWSIVNAPVGRRRLSPEDVLVLELDRDLLRDEFYRTNSLVGRLQDNLPWRSTHDIIDSLRVANDEWFANASNRSFPDVLRRRVWLLLVDITLSGTSVLSELERLRAIQHVLFPADAAPTLVAAVQVATAPALTKLREAGLMTHAAAVIPTTHALGLPEFRAVTNPRVVASMHAVCAWFAREHVLPSHYRFGKLCRAAEANGSSEGLKLATYGFGKAGWSVATYKNTPNNSLPLLWFRPDTSGYHPPFERIDSRTHDTWSGRGDWIRSLLQEETAQRTLRALLFEGRT